MNLPIQHPYSNPDSKIYWDAVNNGTLLIRICRTCGVSHFLPRHHCPKCWSSDLEWIPSSGTGTVYSFSVVHRAPLESFSNKVPYVIALIDLTEGPRMLTNIIGRGALSTSVGDKVRVAFEEIDPGINLPQFCLEKYIEKQV